MQKEQAVHRSAKPVFCWGGNGRRLKMRSDSAVPAGIRFLAWGDYHKQPV